MLFPLLAHPRPSHPSRSSQHIAFLRLLKMDECPCFWIPRKGPVYLSISPGLRSHSSEAGIFHPYSPVPNTELHAESVSGACGLCE